MEFIQKIKTPLIIVGIFIAAFVLYRNFMVNPEAPAITEEAVVGANAGLVIQTEEFRAALDKLNLIKLDDSVFATPQFQTLIDNTARALERLEAARSVNPPGKANPFLPLSSQQIPTGGSGQSRSPLPGR